MLNLQHRFQRLLVWREHSIPAKYFTMILSFFVGLFCALAAHILKNIVDYLHEVVKNAVEVSSMNYLYFVMPIVGIFLASTFVRYIVKDDISHGVTKILYAISQRQAVIKAHNMWSSLVASSLTIGFGGSVGAEAPIVLTGSAIGSNLGRVFRMDRKTLMLLVGCGASAAVAGIFKAPITGVIFTLEVLLLDLTMATVVPLLISSITASLVTYFLSGSDFMFGFSISDPFTPSRTPFYILLGILCGFISLYFTRGMTRLEASFGSLQSPTKKMVIGGIMLSVLIFMLPPLYGEGYNTITALLSNDVVKVTENSAFYQFKEHFWMLFLFLGLLVMLKIFASAATNCAGGTGGIFAPSLFVGCITGYLMAMLVNYTQFFRLPEKNFALAGMAGVMAGVMHAPLTGTFLIAELTGGYGLFVSLMITATIAYITIIIFEPHSLYAQRLALKGELLTHHKDRTVLTLLRMDDVIEQDLQKLNPDMYLEDLVKVISRTKRNIYPVLNKKGYLIGIITLDEIRNIMFRPELYTKFQVSDLMTAPPDTLSLHDSMEVVMEKFEKTQVWNLPVVEDKKYIGFVSKAKIFNEYRNILVQLSEE
ncbi:MAG: chloride channel protein [Paludibacteraceae bacterium]|nr:chloride channel protein [Paludibacteraceae bacterium]